MKILSVRISKGRYPSDYQGDPQVVDVSAEALVGGGFRFWVEDPPEYTLIHCAGAGKGITPPRRCVRMKDDSLGFPRFRPAVEGDDCGWGWFTFCVAAPDHADYLISLHDGANFMLSKLRDWQTTTGSYAELLRFIIGSVG